MSKKHKPACPHLRGYWINRTRGRFRCYGCGMQYNTSDLTEKRERQIEFARTKPLARLGAR